MTDESEKTKESEYEPAKNEMDEPAPKKQKEPTKVLIARVFQKAGLHKIAAKAMSGLYDDYESDHPTPKVLLATELRLAGRDDLARRCMAGEFDNTKEEAEAWTNEASDKDPELRDVIK